jgi:hypothetical protein|tara:strand:- start:271 stop:648 length:378 start_codon:yes stop_codon:yes gene_type:complete
MMTKQKRQEVIKQTRERFDVKKFQINGAINIGCPFCEIAKNSCLECEISPWAPEVDPFCGGIIWDKIEDEPGSGIIHCSDAVIFCDADEDTWKQICENINHHMNLIEFYYWAIGEVKERGKEVCV